MSRDRAGILRRAAAAGLVVAVSACGGVDRRGDAAVAAAERFFAALRDGDAATACSVLGPRTRQELEASAGQDCTGALPGEQLGDPGAVHHVDVYGDQVRVEFGDDTVFVARFQDGWKVVAAGCRPRADQPYDCALKGG